MQLKARLQAEYEKHVKSRKGQGPLAVVLGIVAFIAVAISIAIGYIVLVTTVNTAQSAATGLTSTQSVNLLNLTASMTGSFLLLTVLPVVLAAGLIIGALFLFMHFGRAGE
jgi:ABC-type multidrug transport system permease subunit